MANYKTITNILRLLYNTKLDLSIKISNFILKIYKRRPICAYCSKTYSIFLLLRKQK